MRAGARLGRTRRSRGGSDMSKWVQVILVVLVAVFVCIFGVRVYYRDVLPQQFYYGHK